MFDNKIRSIYKDFNGIEVYSDYLALLGFTADEGTPIKISVGGWSYKDYSVSGDSFSGTELEYYEGVSGWTSGCTTGNSAQGDQIGIETAIPSQYAAAGVRCAAYVTTEGTEGAQWCHILLRCYNPATEQFTNQTPFALYDMSNGNRDNFYLIGLPGSAPPGMVTWKWSRVDEMLTGCNTIRGLPAAEYRGVYYNITQVSMNIPFFDSLEHCDAYLTDLTDSTTQGLLNRDQSDPEAAYDEMFDFWWVKNKFGRNTRNVLSPNVEGRNYRFFPKTEGICFVKSTPTSSNPYAYKLYHYSGYTCKTADEYDASDDEYYEIGSGQVARNYVPTSVAWGVDDYITKFDFDTNIPRFDSEQEADDFFNGLIPITDAANFDYISRRDNSIVDPVFQGTTADETTDLGTNGQYYGMGNRMYEISHTELSSFFIELFTPANAQDIMDGNKLFNAGTMQAISGILFVPFADLEDFCELGSLAKIKVGAWEAENAEGRRITKNNKTKSIGSFFWTPTYNDFRDFEPYTLAFINLPYIGIKPLTISKYYNKQCEIRYALDITSGGILAMIFGDGILLDQWEGCCGSSRPISATDNNAYISNIMNALSGASAQTGNGAASIGNSLKNVAGAAGGAASIASGVGAVAGAGAIAVGGVYTAYNVKSAIDQPPTMTAGALTGCLGYFSNTKVTLIIAQKDARRPENELQTIGYPSGHGGAVGSFAGFLQCSAFKLATGFTGTERERQDILNIMKNGIYIE